MDRKTGNHSFGLHLLLAAFLLIGMLGLAALQSQPTGAGREYLPGALSSNSPGPFAIFLPYISSSCSNCIYVDVHNTGLEDGSKAHPYNTIQEAVDHSSNGGTILVAPGIYPENVTIGFMHPWGPFTIRSESGPAATIIDGAGKAAAMIIYTGRDVVVDGFTIRNGGGQGLTSDGAGVAILDGTAQTGKVTIQNNIITQNNTNAGIVVDSHYVNAHFDVSILRNRVTRNGEGTTATAGHGGGISVYLPDNTTGTIRISSNLVALNSSGSLGGGLSLYGNLQPGGNVIAVFNNTIARNTGDVGGGIQANISSLSLVNNIVFSNTASSLGNDLYLVQNSLSATIVSNVIGDGQYVGSNGNISSDPQFVSPSTGDFHLKPGSPAIDAGTTVSVLTDLDGKARPIDGDGSGSAEWDIGAYEYSP